MIKNNVLADRLNAYRNGDPMPEIEKEIENYSQLLKEPEQQHTKISLLKEIGYETLNLSFVVLKSAAFGFAIESLFNYDWNVLAMMSVGFSLQVIISEIRHIFTKK